MIIFHHLLPCKHIILRFSAAINIISVFPFHKKIVLSVDILYFISTGKIFSQKKAFCKVAIFRKSTLIFQIPMIKNRLTIFVKRNGQQRKAIFFFFIRIETLNRFGESEGFPISKHKRIRNKGFIHVITFPDIFFTIFFMVNLF